MNKKPEKGRTFIDECTRCGFLKTLIQGCGLNNRDLGRMMDRSYNTTFYWFDHDNCSLRAARTLCDMLGFDLTYRFFKDTKELEEPAVFDTMYYKVDKEGRIGELLNLAPLRQAVRRFLGTKVRYAQLIGMTPAAITYWWSTDDVQLSRLYEAAKVMNCDLFIDVSPKKKVIYDADASDGHVYTRVCFESSFPAKDYVGAAQQGCGKKDGGKDDKTK